MLLQIVGWAIVLNGVFVIVLGLMLAFHVD